MNEQIPTNQELTDAPVDEVFVPALATATPASVEDMATWVADVGSGMTDADAKRLVQRTSLVAWGSGPATGRLRGHAGRPIRFADGSVGISPPPSARALGSRTSAGHGPVAFSAEHRM
jgi:hypothetical protein